MVLNILFAMAVSLLPLKVGEVLDMITLTSTDESSTNMGELRVSIIELGVMTLFLALFTYCRFLSLQFLQEYLALDMRNDIYKKFMENDLYFF